MFSADPPAAGAWYAKQFGCSFPQTEKRVYRDVQIAPAAFVTADHVSMIIYPVEYRGGTIVSTRGRVIDHSVSASTTSTPRSRACATTA